MRSSKIALILGSQWGDEGKGKWIDTLCSNFKIIARFQGGPNAGHTILRKQTKFVLHQLPSGILHPEKISVLTRGMVINPVTLMTELSQIANFTMPSPETLWISSAVPLITPWHIDRDKKSEQQSSKPIGTTLRGIGPSYSDFVSRHALTLGSCLDRDALAEWLDRMREQDPKFGVFFKAEQAAWQSFFEAAAALLPFVCDAESRIRTRIALGDSLLIEGAQGTLLDLHHGSYPYVTSSSTIAGGAIVSLGIDPRKIDVIYGVAKAYTTRVGEGPFPTELSDDVGSYLRKTGQEFGATTGRPRRCGWFDAVAMRYAVQVNGLDGLFVNKLDILSGLSELKVAVAYRHPFLGEISEFPSDTKTLSECVPIYETFSGWSESLTGMTHRDQLPKAAKEFLAALASYSGVSILQVGTGPNQDDKCSYTPESGMAL